MNIKIFLATVFLCFTIDSDSETLNPEETWVLDSRFAAFDIVQMVKLNYPELKIKAQQISHYSAYYNVNPFLLSESLLVNETSVSELAKRLFSIIHNKNLYTSQEMIKLFDLNEVTIEQVLSMIHQNKDIHKKSRVDLQSVPVFDLPFDHKKEWNFNGVHTWTGDNDGTPMSSIDLTENWNQVWGDDTSEAWVSAAHGGIITVIDSCYVRITHPSGWATDYYHLNNIQYETGDVVQAGDYIANYADSMVQALCQGGASSGPHVHFSLLKNGIRQPLNGVELSKWMIHPGNTSYDSSSDRMWLERNGQKKFAFQDSLEHFNGDNIVDYRYSGVFSSTEISGHGVNISITQAQINNSSEFKHIIFIAFYTYSDDGKANFYAGNIDFENWRIDEEKTVPMIQTSGGNFTDLNTIDFTTDVVDAGFMKIHFINCNEVEVGFNLLEPTNLEMIEAELVLTKLVGIPDQVCQSPSQFIN